MCVTQGWCLLVSASVPKAAIVGEVALELLQVMGDRDVARACIDSFAVVMTNHVESPHARVGERLGPWVCE